MSSSSRFEQAVNRIEAANTDDPRVEVYEGKRYPSELLYAQRLVATVRELAPHPSEALLLAAYAQHIRRWTIARSTHPDGLAGYLQWRETLKQFHADTAAEILEEVGYDVSAIDAVRALILKADFPEDPDSRVLEDALCLVFLRHQLADTARKYPEEKMVGILQKTWEKMTPQAKTLALAIPFGEQEAALIEKANLSL